VGADLSANLAKGLTAIPDEIGPTDQAYFQYLGNTVGADLSANLAKGLTAIPD
jgi:hypothetical protein